MRPLSSLRLPEFTGENRCLPCTVVNLVIAAVASVAVGAVLSTMSPAFGVAGGACLLFASVTLVWLRGYLVPGTPALTRQYMPPWLLKTFGKDPAVGSDQTVGAAEDPADVDLESLFRDAGVVEPCEDVDDLCRPQSTTWRPISTPRASSRRSDWSARPLPSPGTTTRWPSGPAVTSWGGGRPEPRCG